MVASGVTLSAENDCSSTMGPAGLERTPTKVWSFAAFSLKMTVSGSGAETLSTLPSRYDGPFASAILVWRSNENLTSDDVSLWPLANVRPGLSLTVNVVGVVNLPDCAISGVGVDEPTGESNRYGNTCV
jgi:hypothetical protein